MEVVKVVCGIIYKDDKILIARRKPGKSLEGYWEFPGGKLQKDENPEIALKRELKEELGMEVNETMYYGSHVHRYENITIELMAYTCKFLQATFEMTDHDKFEFITTKDFDKFIIAPADIHFVSILKSQI